MSSSDSKNLGLQIASAIFGVVSVLHLLRLLTAVQVLIGRWSLPIWVNIFGFIVTASLCFWLWRLAKK